MIMKTSVKTTLWLVSATGLLQLLLISYNHYTGYINISGPANFFHRLMIGTFFSSIFGGLALWIDLRLYRYTCTRFATEEPLLRRLAVAALLAVVSGSALGLALTLTAHLLLPYQEPLFEVLLTNMLIVMLLNLLITGILEMFFLQQRNRSNRSRADCLERENLRLQFETLKKQLDPHFLFNSLNVLSSLVATDAARAQEFIDQFSSIYRYTLSAIDRPVVSLGEEAEYVRSYLYLQSIRFSGGVHTEINVEQENANLLLPPLAVQTCLENAFKHNQASSEAPLHIRIYTNADRLVVENTQNRKIGDPPRSGLGLANLCKRYELVCDQQPEIAATATTFTITLPLLRPQ